MRGKIKALAHDFESGRQILTLELFDDFRALYDDLNGHELSIEIKKYREKRSLNANAYLWVLIGRLAEKLRLPTVEVYREYVRDFGVYEVIPIKEEASERFIQSWSKNGLGWIAEPMHRESKLKGYVNIVCYYGTSVYDRAEFSRILDAVVEDCKAQGIETYNPNEIERLVEAYFS
ncbi:MAG: hypothetical protein GX938_09545 [Spirochaetales bacterium]|nr:hypothetical protein [Spirochaetales bacterium]